MRFRVKKSWKTNIILSFIKQLPSLNEFKFYNLKKSMWTLFPSPLMIFIFTFYSIHFACNSCLAERREEKKSHKSWESFSLLQNQQLYNRICWKGSAWRFFFVERKKKLNIKERREMETTSSAWSRGKLL